LPLELKAVEPRLRSLLRGTGATLRVVHPEPLAGESRAVGSAAGLAPVTVQQVRHDTVLTRQVWCGMRLARAGTQALVPRIDAAAAAHLEFLLGAALRRLDGQPAPAVALVASPPRLSPAEALEDYQRKGLVPPSGPDVYGRLHARLADYGYQVRRVPPDSARFGDPAELVVWLQPRRDSSPAAAELARHLHAGGRALVALQHFRIQQRQYRGTGFETVYWPQPQFQDLDPLLGAYGLTQVREVLMDRTRSHLLLETQINRAAVREYDRQQVALPFLLRVVGSGLSPRHPVTRQLGDLLFCWGNRFALDPAALRRAGLEADTLAATSPQAWAYAWSGGWLPPEAFAPATRLGGPQPLIVSLRGRFPAVTRRPGADGGWEWVADPAAPGERPGELLLIGCAAMFEDGLLEEPGFAHQQLLLNAVAWLACGPELAAVQARQQAPRGFAQVSPGARIGWRLAGVAGGPLFFALLGLGILGAQRRRAP